MCSSDLVFQSKSTLTIKQFVPLIVTENVFCGSEYVSQ